MVDAGNLEKLVQSVDELFRIPILNIEDPSARANSADLLSHAALKASYLMLLSSGMLQDGKFIAHRFLPEAVKPFLEQLVVRDLTYEELQRNLAVRRELRRGIVSMARKNPSYLKEFMGALRLYVNNTFYDPATGQVHEDFSDAETNHSTVTRLTAYKVAPEVFREASLSLVGEGKYILGIKPSGIVTRRIREPPQNIAAWGEWQEKWMALAGHALSFLELDTVSLDRIVGEADVWSGVDVIEGYPRIRNAAESAWRMLKFGYDNKVYFRPIPHRFVLSDRRGNYRKGQSMTEITVLDLGNAANGVLYKIRHNDSSIAIGRLMLFDPENSEFGFTQSNMPQLIGLSLNPDMEPFYAACSIVAAQARDMMVKVVVERNEKRPYFSMAAIPPDGTTPSEHVIILPRTQFVYNTDPNLSSSEGSRVSRLVRTELSRFIGPHPLRLRPGSRPDPQKVSIAVLHGVPLAPNQTYRGGSQGYWIGNGNNPEAHNDRLFRSRSAMELLYSSKVAAKDTQAVSGTDNAASLRSV